MGRIIIYNFIRFAVVVLLQVALFKNMGYYNIATPFPYLFFLFLLPIGIPNLLLFLICFTTGLTIDAFYDSIGVHAAACVALALFRIFFYRITLEVEVRDSFNTPSLGEMGTKWFFPYVLIGTLIHHATLYLIEAFSFTNMLYTLASIILSSIFTVLIMLLMSLLVYRKKSRVGSF